MMMAESTSWRDYRPLPEITIGLLLLVFAAACNPVATTEPDPTVDLTSISDSTYWEPIPIQMPDCSSRYVQWDGVERHILRAWQYRTRAFVRDSCCWVIGGRPPFRQIIIYAQDPNRWYNSEHPINTVVSVSRVLRAAEWDSTNTDREMVAADLDTVLAVTQRLYENQTAQKCWRRCLPTSSVPCRSFPAGAPEVEFMYIGPPFAAPADYEWTVALRRRYQYPPPDGTKLDFHVTP